MGETTKIEWTDHTFNPWWGCTKVSQGCAHCYADTFSKRTGHDIWGPGKPRRFFGAKHWAEPLKWNAKAEAEGRRHRVFCASMADVFEGAETCQNEEAYAGIQAARLRLFELIRTTPMLDWQLLTKRPENILPSLKQALGKLHKVTSNSIELSRWLLKWIDGDAPSNAWLGYSVPNQEDADRGIPELLKIPAAIRFLSCEPLITPVDLQLNKDVRQFLLFGASAAERRVMQRRGIHWVIVGGESGPGARPMHPDWALGLRDQCAEAGVAFFLKQWGEWSPWADYGKTQCEVNLDGTWAEKRYPLKLEWKPGCKSMWRVGKRISGNLLDGQVYQQFPEVSA